MRDAACMSELLDLGVVCVGGRAQDQLGDAAETFVRQVYGALYRRVCATGYNLHEARVVTTLRIICAECRGWCECGETSLMAFVATILHGLPYSLLVLGHEKSTLNCFCPASSPAFRTAKMTVKKLVNTAAVMVQRYIFTGQLEGCDGAIKAVQCLTTRQNQIPVVAGGCCGARGKGESMLGKRHRRTCPARGDWRNTSSQAWKHSTD